MSALERRTLFSLLADPPALPDRSAALGFRERRPRALLSQRSWQIRWSRHGIAIGHSRYLSVEAYAMVRRHFASSAALLLVCAAVGIGALGVVASRESRDSDHYQLSIDLPDRTPARPFLPPPPVFAHADKAMAAHPAASRVRQQPEHSRPAVTAPVDDLEAESAVTAAPPSVPDGIFKAEGPAVAAALASGQLQSWQDPAHARRGFIVVGASEGGDDRTCRDLTILVRQDGAENNVTKRHMCKVGAKGAWR